MADSNGDLYRKAMNGEINPSEFYRLLSERAYRIRETGNTQGQSSSSFSSFTEPTIRGKIVINGKERFFQLSESINDIRQVADPIANEIHKAIKNYPDGWSSVSGETPEVKSEEEGKEDETEVEDTSDSRIDPAFE